MDETAVRRGIEELIAAYAECIDDDQLEEWPDFFLEDCRYLITSRQSYEAGYRHGVV
jgi:anthranilate 1,2-dioxygenase small subunit